MKGIVARTRVEWIQQDLKPHRRFTVGQMQRVINRRRERGWITAMPADGPVLEKLVFVHDEQPAAEIVEAYNTGVRWFQRPVLDSLVNAPVDCKLGAARLGLVGFALQEERGALVELLAADPDEAKVVNEARCGHSKRGYGVRRIIEAMLHLRNPGRSRVNVNDDRRLMAAEKLVEQWAIHCDDLLGGRMRVRLMSAWTF